MENIVDVIRNGERLFFKLNNDLSISRSNDCKNWEQIDFTFITNHIFDENGSAIPNKVTSVSLKVEGDQVILVTNVGNWTTINDEKVIGDTWIPC